MVHCSVSMYNNHYSSVPSMPDVIIRAVTNSSVNIVWIQAKSDRVGYYIIHYFYNDQCNYTFQNIINHTNIDRKELNISSLQGFGTYTINITAVNSQGRSTSSTNFTVYPAGIYVCKNFQLLKCLIYDNYSSTGETSTPFRWCC